VELLYVLKTLPNLGLNIAFNVYLP